MPLPQYSPWQEASAGVNRMGDTFTNLMLELARQKYQTNYRDQMMAMRQAEFQRRQQASQANQDFDAARVRQIDQGNAAANDLGNVMEWLYQTDQQKNPDVYSMLESRAAGTSGRLAGLGNRFVPENLAQLIEMRDPAFRRILAAGGADKLYHNTPQGAISTPGVADLPTVMGGFTLGPGQERFAPQILEALLPAAQMSMTNQPMARSSVPPRAPQGQQDPLLDDLLRAMLNEHFITLKPEIQGQVESGFTNRPPVIRGTNQPMAAPPSSELIEVTNPQGKRVRIRKAQLQEALASGYTQ